MKIFLLLGALYFVANFYVFVGLLVEFWMYKTEDYSFELKRYHILELIVCPISCIIFFFILLLFYLIKFVFKAIGKFFKLICEWLDVTIYVWEEKLN